MASAGFKLQDMMYAAAHVILQSASGCMPVEATDAKLQGKRPGTARSMACYAQRTLWLHSGSIL